MAALAPDLGWSEAALNRAARETGFSPAETALLLPGGARDLAALCSRRHDDAALQALSAVDPRSLRMRERILRGVLARLEAAAVSPDTTRRWAGFLTLPSNVPLGLRLAWDSADRLWRWAGDTATDENHYSKRAILSGILLGALPIRLSAGREAAEAFVYARVGEVMRLEAWKATRPRADLGARLDAR